MGNMGTRCTIAGRVVLEGRGLFTGLPGRVGIAAGSGGIGFSRPGGARVPGTIARVERSPAGARHTTISLAGADRFGTILDGSAEPIVRAILDAGLRPLDLPAPGPLVLGEPARVESGGASIEARPRRGPGWSVEYALDYGPGSGLPSQLFRWEGDAGSYAREIAPARTFSPRAEAERARAAGLFSHLCPRDMLVIDADGRAMDNELRFADEPARHKVLDLIGDLALLGRAIQADVLARRSGHALTHDLVRALDGAPGCNAGGGER